ncbi:hypothetical protein [Sphingomonas sp.]|jgi:DNA-binding transcriptional ArsR family regulator|uniref:hypothetical protein n=1 Tax=Sphingomonas sp. TaxID=28214 RepID=UPI002DE6DDBF|nr:hypothetical protein [Sphingomonas sp.]
MSAIKNAMHDAMDALGEEAFDSLLANDVDRAIDEVIEQRKAIEQAYEQLRSGGLEVQHQTLRTVLMRLHGVQPEGTPAFNARLKHLLEMGLITDRRVLGRGRRSYRLVDILELALCLQLQRSYVPPATAVRFVMVNRDHLDKVWVGGSTGNQTPLHLRVDALAAIGDASRTMGRGSRGNETGTISLTRMRHPGPKAVPPATLTVDMLHLQLLVHDHLVRAAVQRLGLIRPSGDDQ